MTTSVHDLQADAEARAKQLGHVMGSWTQYWCHPGGWSCCERCGKTVRAVAGSMSMGCGIEPRTSGPAVSSRCDSHQLFELTSSECEADRIASSLGHVLGTWERRNSESRSECIACGQVARVMSGSNVQSHGALKEACPVDWRERERRFKKRADDLASSAGHVLEWTYIRWSPPNALLENEYVVQGWCKRCKTAARMGRADGQVYSWPVDQSCKERALNTQADDAKQKNLKARQVTREKHLITSAAVGLGVVSLVITAVFVATDGAGMILLFPFVVGGVFWLGFWLFGAFQGARETASRHTKGPVSFTILFILVFVAILLFVGIIAVLAPDVSKSGATIP